MLTARAYLVFLAITVLVLVSGAAASAGTPPVPIEGKLWVSGYNSQTGWAQYGYFLHGTSAEATYWPGPVQHADMSPLGDALAYHVTTGQPYATTGHVWVSSLDAVTKTNLTQAAGLGGINCFPYWSPDATQIAFRHVDPVPGEEPCDTGFQVWVMDADGTDARRVSPEGSASIKLGGWSADGYRLVCALYGVGAVSMRLDGSDIRALPNVRGEGIDVSPDALHIAGTWAQRATVDGAPGLWRELRATDSDGGNPQTLVSQFVKDSDAEAMVARLGLDTSVRDWVADVEWWAGPLFPQWSPKGDRIAFLAALPFDPDGADFRAQVEVWVYTLANGDLTRITNDLSFDAWLSWQGENTFPDYAHVTVDNTTVAFAEVTEPGLTTIIREDGPPALPANHRVAGPFYQVRTTAEVAGPISVWMSYQDGVVAPAAEGHLTILRYDDGAMGWVTLPVTCDIADNVVRGETTSLGLMGLTWPLPPSHFSDVSSSEANPYWALWEIEAAYAAGIVSGYDDDTYRPTLHVPAAGLARYRASAKLEQPSWGPEQRAARPLISNHRRGR